mgnify:CR=1 FL=1
METKTIQRDTGVCPGCNRTFTVERYGRRIPCPHCGEPLDIAPEFENPLSAAEWQRAITAEIQYLGALKIEVEESRELAGAQDYTARILDRIARLHSLAIRP